ncbi:MAG: fructose-6-phosphate aldolase [Planctomycetales bacterium 4484_113]|nr:MAG: fructose-6-phosphate aldolase [Planctomycetales bacterium 4484_113]
MQIFLDTANVDEIHQGVAMGLVDGVTTNPTLVAREKRKFRECIEEICSLVDGPVSAEVTATDTEGMIREAREISSWAENIVVKIPMVPEGLVAVRRLTEEGIRTNVTLVFSANQALLAAKAGAYFCSPFIGRIDDIGEDGMEVLSEIVSVYDTYGFETQVLAASMRHPHHVREAALIGADIATVPFKVFAQLARHPLTDVGIKRFLEDWEKVEDLV